MDSHQVDQLARALSGTRRALLPGALALAAGWLGIGVTGARKHKHKKKPKKPKPNEFACLSVGKRCKSTDQCCSGICTGKKGKRRCRAHDTGTCAQGIPGVCDPENPTIAICNSDACLCMSTTAGSNYCANGNFNQCSDCTKDADCEALGLPPGSACIPFPLTCTDQCESGMTCVIPCGVAPPEPREQ
jgi:hypothetical protein